MLPVLLAQLRLRPQVYTYDGLGKDDAVEFIGVWLHS